MGSPRKSQTIVNIGAPIPIAIADSFKRLCEESGLSMRKGLERCLLDAIRKNKVPGVEIMSYEEKINAEKFGDGGVDRYDGDETKEPTPIQDSGRDRAIS